MSNYSKTTDFAAKDSLPSGDSGKIIRGSEFETEFDAISTAIATKADAASPTFTGTVTIDGLTVNGNTVLGNAATDTVTVTADIASNLIPSADDTYNLGAVGAEWNDLYVDGVAYIDTIDGFATTGNVTFGDNDKAIFGAGSDLQIFHDGSNSYISDSGTGDLQIKGTNLYLKGSNNETFMYAVENGPVRLYHDNSQKLITTTTGIDVTGTVNAGDEYRLSNFSFSRIAQKDGGGGFAGGYNFKLDGSNPEHDSTGTLAGYHYTSGGQIRLYASPSSAANTSATERVRIENDGDISFYEDTGTTAKFFWDASAESLGIGTTSPTAKLESLSTSAGSDSAALHLRNASDTANTEVRAYFTPNTSTALNRSAYVGAISETAGNDSELVFGTNASGASPAEAMRIDSSGNVGIGTSSPDRLLNVVGTDTVIADFENTTATGNGRIAVTTGSSTAYFTQFGQSHATTPNLTQISAPSETRFINAGVTVATMKSSGNVGIGTTSPSSALDVVGVVTTDKVEIEGSSAGLLNMYRTGTNANFSAITFSNSANTATNAKIGWNVNELRLEGTTQMTFNTNSSEAMRIDSSGNLLVGTTTLAPATAGNTSGAHIYPSGQGQFSQVSAASGVFNRKTSDGAILDFRKDGSTVGSIGSLSGTTYIAGSSKGVRFGSGALIPTDSAGQNSDASYDLGDSSVRWRDLKLSGGVFLGGTAAANKLDDYEEGTFTPVVADASSGGNTATVANADGWYTKVGNLVSIGIRLLDIDTSGMTSSNAVFITGLPFVSSSTSYGNSGSVTLDRVNFTGYVSAKQQQNATHINLRNMISGSLDANILVSAITSTGSDIEISLQYKTA